MNFSSIALFFCPYRFRSCLLVTISIWLVFAPCTLRSQQFSENETKAARLYQIAQHINWPNTNKVDSFTILLITDNFELVTDTRNLLENRQIHGLPILVKSTPGWSAHGFQNEKILYIDSKFQSQLPVIRLATHGKSLLIANEPVEGKSKAMVHLGSSNPRDGKTSYTVNAQELSAGGLVADFLLVRLGNTNPLINQLIIRSEFELQDERGRLEKNRLQLEVQSTLIEEQNWKIQMLKQELAQLESNTDLDKSENINQRELLAQLKKSVYSNQQVFSNKLAVLAARELQLAELKEEINNQQYIIKAQEEDIGRRNKLLTKLDNDIAKQNSRILEQRDNLYMLEQRFNKQKGWLYFFALAVILSVASIVLLFKAYRTKRKASIALEEKNRAIVMKSSLIEQQKEEIEAQSEMLEQTNRELEKLSIVASETDNSVIIMDPKGNFDWVNSGFTKMTGLSLEELKELKGKNIRANSSNPKIDQILDYCIKNRKAVIYDSYFQKIDTEIVWLQTTLTPILAANGRVEKLVAIDSNITKIKEVERELQHSNEELKTQRDELTIQKGRIERQNRHITESMMYAQTIQNAILPLKEEMDKLYKTFIVYKPKDIVSGDFYWYTPLPNQGNFTRRTLIAVADCTGHGVPGALMSMIGSSLLNETVHEKGISLPHLILKELDLAFRKALKQEKRNSLDGLEVCLCLLETNREGTYVRFAGAKQSLYHFNASEESIYRIKATPREIGGFIYKNEEKNFELNSIKLNRADCLYLCSDGFADQAGKDNARYGKQRLLKTLREIGAKPLALQQELLEQSLMLWQQDIKQRDDITIVGIKIE